MNNMQRIPKKLLRDMSQCVLDHIDQRLYEEAMSTRRREFPGILPRGRVMLTCSTPQSRESWARGWWAMDEQSTSCEISPEYYIG